MHSFYPADDWRPGGAADTDDLLDGYASGDQCSESIINLFCHQQSTPYLNNGPEMTAAWAAIRANYDLDYHTVTQTLKTNVTSPANYEPSEYTTSACVSGQTYTVISGDNSNDIAKKAGVSTGSLITLNSLRIDCSNLLLGQVRYHQSSSLYSRRLILFIKG